MRHHLDASAAKTKISPVHAIMAGIEFRRHYAFAAGIANTANPKVLQLEEQARGVERPNSAFTSELVSSTSGIRRRETPCVAPHVRKFSSVVLKDVRNTSDTL